MMDLTLAANNGGRMTGLDLAPAPGHSTGLAQVLLRIDPAAPLRYLDELEVDRVMSVDTYRYRELVETNSPGRRETFVS